MKQQLENQNHQISQAQQKQLLLMKKLLDLQSQHKMSCEDLDNAVKDKVAGLNQKITQYESYQQ